MTENDAKFEYEIKLKRLEIDKLKIERDLHNKLNEINDLSNNISSVSSEDEIALKNNQLALKSQDFSNSSILLIVNLVFLSICIILLHFMPWISFQANVSSDYIPEEFEFNHQLTGFNLGLFLFSYPLTIIHIVILVLNIARQYKIVGYIALAGLLLSILSVASVIRLNDVTTTFSSDYGNVSTGFKSTGWMLAFPGVYVLLSYFNLRFKETSPQKQPSIEIKRVYLPDKTPYLKFIICFFLIVLLGLFLYGLNKNIIENPFEKGAEKSPSSILEMTTDSLEASIDTSSTDISPQIHAIPLFVDIDTVFDSHKADFLAKLYIKNDESRFNFLQDSNDAYKVLIIDKITHEEYFYDQDLQHVLEYTFYSDYGIEEIIKHYQATRKYQMNNVIVNGMSVNLKNTDMECVSIDLEKAAHKTKVRFIWLCPDSYNYLLE